MSEGKMDPQLRAFNDYRERLAAQYPDIYKSPLQVARRSIELAQATFNEGGPRMFKTEDRWMVIPGRRILVRVHYPTNAPNLPVVVFLHGGGWVWNSIDTHDRVAREYAARAGVAVISPDYVSAPEYPFPAALNECVAVVRWVRENGTTWNLDGSRVAIGGDSAGANLSLATVLAMRDAGDEMLRGALLNYPPLDPELETDSYTRYPQQRPRMTWYWAQYLQQQTDRKNPLAAPSLARMDGLPPLRFSVGEIDALVDENVALAKRALAAGNETEIEVYPGMNHSFLRAVGHVDTTDRAIQAGADWLARRLQ